MSHSNGAEGKVYPILPCRPAPRRMLFQVSSCHIGSNYVSLSTVGEKKPACSLDLKAPLITYR